MANVGVLGAGSWGTALSVLLCENGHQVTVWSIDREEVKMLTEKREHAAKLPGVKLPENLEEFLAGGSFYYPMPDYKLPSVIYSDRYLPKKGDLTGMPALYDYPEYLLMDVGAAYDAVCEDGQFENFANSFLVIWSAHKNEGE